ncbi:hypothetical protein RND81_06G133900 [Saponaria officinalis]|uniref:Uncharacterized protein n=1 Tax=Saponaria officinalis TaxID=3572 RepID=A0AAW1K9G2_SAPOF
MSSEGATPEIAVDIVSIESAAVEGTVKEDEFDRKKQSRAVQHSDILGQEQQATAALAETNTSEDDMSETKEFNLEHQNSKIPGTYADQMEDELDAESQNTDSEVRSAINSELSTPTQPSPAGTFPSWNPPPNLDSCYVNEYSSRLFRAALGGDWEAVMLIAEEAPAWIRTGITKGGKTVVHIAAATKHVQVVKALIACDPSSLLYTNKEGNTPFCSAVMTGVVEIAKAMQEHNNELPNFRNRHGLIPLNMAVLLGHRAMVWYLLEVTDHKMLTNEDLIEILTGSIETDLFDVALHILKNNLHLAFLRDDKGETALHVLARKPLKRVGNRPSIWRIFLGSYTSNGEETKEVLELTQILWNQVIRLNKDDISAYISQPWHLLFVAARIGKVEFLTLLIQSYPHLIWKVDDYGYNMFHMAIIYRQAEIFKLLYAIGANNDLLAIYKDRNENNILHLVSKLAPLDRLMEYIN